MSSRRTVRIVPQRRTPADTRRRSRRHGRLTLRRAKVPYFRIYDLRSTYATRLSAGGVADEWVTQLLRQGDAKVFKKYSQMKLQMKREALQKLNRTANEIGGVLGQDGDDGSFGDSFGTVLRQISPGKRRSRTDGCENCSRIKDLQSRGVAQPGSAPALGAGGRWFESSRPDHSLASQGLRRTDRFRNRAAEAALGTNPVAPTNPFSSSVRSNPSLRSIAAEVAVVAIAAPTSYQYRLGAIA